MKKLISLILTLCIVASLAICPVSADAADSLSVAYAGNGIFNVTGTVSGDGDYKLIMAEFDDENMFVGATTILDITDETFSTTLDFTANDKLSSTLKLMLWDMTAGAPVAEAVVNPKGDGGVNVATAATAVVGGTGSANVGLLGTPGALIDGQDSTWTGFYATRGTTGYIYVDLQDYYEIDRIEVLSYSDNPNLGSAGARGTEYDVVLGNEVPDGTAFDAENPNGEFKAAYVDFDERAKDMNVGYKTIYVPENAGEFRYVSFEKWNPERAGLLIGEVKVYVKEENIPEYVNVAQGKFAAGSTSATGNVGLYYTDSTGYIANATGDKAARIVDGDKTTGAGFMVGANVNGNFYVDLGAEYEISHIKVLSYNSTNADRADKYTVVMSNAVRNGSTSPDANKYEFAQVTGATTSDASTAQFRTFIAPKNDKTYRFVSVEKFVAGAGLSVAEIEVYVEKDDVVAAPEYVNVAQGKATGGSQIAQDGTVSSTLMYTSANLVDGNEANSNLAGFYYSVFKGHMYIDLGAKCKIDHIEVIASNPSRPACAGDYDVVVSNKIPDGTAFDAANPNGRVLVDHANYDSQMTSAANNVRRFYMPTDAEEYRYVSLEKLQDNNMGMLLSEVKVYVKSDEMPVLATNVALGKSTAENVLIAGTGESSYSNGLAAVTDGKKFSENKQQFISMGKGIYCLDLGQSYDVEKVMVDVVGDAYSSNIIVYLAKEPYSNTTGFPKEKTAIIEGAAAWGTDSKTVELATPVNARYIMLWKSDAAFRIGEIEVWGK